MSKTDEQVSMNPVIVMVDEDTSEKNGRAVGRKGVGQQREMDLLISLEHETWRHSEGKRGHIILKSDVEKVIVALQDKLVKYHNGKVIPEETAKREEPVQRYSGGNRQDSLGVCEGNQGALGGLREGEAGVQ